MMDTVITSLIKHVYYSVRNSPTCYNNVKPVVDSNEQYIQ